MAFISTWIGGGGGANPYIGVDLASLAAQQALADQQFAASQFGYGVVDAEGATAQANWEEAQAAWAAAGLQMPLAADARDTSLMQADQSVASADANTRTALSANEAQRMGLLNSERIKQRSLQAIAPSIAAGYRGSAYIDPNAVAQRSDVNAELGILGQQKSVVDNQDSQARLSQSQAGESAGMSRRTAGDQYAYNMANIGLRDQRLGVSKAVLAQTKARMEQERANLGLSQPEYDARTAALAAQKLRVTNPINNQPPQTMTVQDNVSPFWKSAFGPNPSAWFGGNGGGRYFDYETPYFNHNSTFFNYGSD